MGDASAVCDSGINNGYRCTANNTPLKFEVSALFVTCKVMQILCC